MDSDLPKIADKGEDEAMQKLSINHDNMPVGMYVIGVALLTLMVTLRVRMPRRRGIQIVTALPTSGVQVSDMSLTMAPASSVNILELKGQGSFVREQEYNSRSCGWCPSSSQTTSSLTACHAEASGAVLVGSTTNPLMTLGKLS